MDKLLNFLAAASENYEYDPIVMPYRGEEYDVTVTFTNYRMFSDLGEVFDLSPMVEAAQDFEDFTVSVYTNDLKPCGLGDIDADVVKSSVEFHLKR